MTKTARVDVVLSGAEVEALTTIGRDLELRLDVPTGELASLLVAYPPPGWGRVADAPDPVRETLLALGVSL